MNRNLHKVEETLRFMAKRYKSIRYSMALVILFLMGGTNIFSEEVTNPKIIQILEHKKQVMKSSESSWQFGVGYSIAAQKTAYKGRGDKKEKYPYEGIFERSSNVFERSVQIRKDKQKDISRKVMVENEGFPNYDLGLEYGLIRRRQILEEPVTIELNTGITPRIVKKNNINLEVTDVRVEVPKLENELEIPKPTTNTNIVIPSFSPVKPEVIPPALPVPPTFAIVLGADCNEGCDSAIGYIKDITVDGEIRTVNVPGTPRQLTKDSFLNSQLAKENHQNVTNILHYTWRQGKLAETSLAFKMYREGNYIKLLNRKDYPNKGDKINPEAQYVANTGDDIKDIYFNSYNFDKDGPVEFTNPVVESQKTKYDPTDKNHQYFYVGGSRFFEVDGHKKETFALERDRTLNLGGILTLGMVSQENGTTIENRGTITDKEEKNDAWIKNMPYDTTGEGRGKYLTIKGATEEYHISRSKDGYVGYKVGMAQVEENSRSEKNFGGKDLDIQKQVIDNKGLIDFRGERSIGMYVYLPKQHENYNLYQTWAKVINNGRILLSGKESYGMKIAANSNPEAAMENNGIIILRKNPDGVDRADLSVGMALMTDASVSNKVSFTEGRATNKGIIGLEGNISNSIGMFNNIDTDMTNLGIIAITAKAQKENNIYKANIGMRADQVELAYATSPIYETKVINEAATEINVTGQGGIAMVANGSTESFVDTPIDKPEVPIDIMPMSARTTAAEKNRATAINRGNININAGADGLGKDNYGMFANNGASIINEISGRINVKDSLNSIGMTATEISKAENKGLIDIDGINSTGIYNAGEFLMDTDTAVINVAGKQSIGIYTVGANSRTRLGAGTLRIKNSAIGLYSNDSTVDLDNTSGKLSLIADEGGLLFYNSESKTRPTNGTFRLTGNVKATINKGAYAFYLKEAFINPDGNIGDLATLFNNMFGGEDSTGKLDVTLNPGGTLAVLDNPHGNIKLSGTAVPKNTLKALGDKILINPSSSNYKNYAVYRGKLEIDQDVNLDKDIPNAEQDPFYMVDFYSSSVSVDSGKTILGTKQGQVALFQANYNHDGVKGTVGEIVLKNLGTIKLSGNSKNDKTTTAMAGDFVTLINKNIIEMNGKNSVAIYGANGSKILNDKLAFIKVGEESVALYGANRLNTSNLGDNTISIVNSGTIKGIEGKSKALGLFAENNLALNPNINDSTLENKGTIDFSLSDRNIGIKATNSTIVNSGTIKIGIKGVAIDSKNSDIISSGDISLGKQSIAFNLVDSLVGRKLNINSKVNLTENGSTIFNLKNLTFVIDSNMNENVNVISNGKDFTYFRLDNSTLTYTKDKNISENKITFVSAKDSSVDWKSNITLKGEGNIGFYLNGKKASSLKTTAGKTITLGNHAIGIYAMNGSKVENNANINVGSNSIALYLTGENTQVKNTGNLTIGRNSLGIYFKDGNILNNGEINSTQERAEGILLEKSSPVSFVNYAKVNLLGKDSIGIDAVGAKHTIENKADITIGDTNKNVAVAITMQNGGTVKNFKSIKVGKSSVGIYGTTVLTSLEANSSIETGAGGVAIYSKGGIVDLKPSSRIKVGASLAKNREGVAVYNSGNATVINNNLESLSIGKGSVGIVDTGKGTKIHNNLSEVSLNGNSMYTYTEATDSKVYGKTKITSSGDGNYGYYVAGDLINYAGLGDIDFSNGIGNVGIYSAYKAGGKGVAENRANIKVGRSDAGRNLYSIGMAAGYNTNKVGHIVNALGATITVANDKSIGMYASGLGSIAQNRGTILVTGREATGMYLENGAMGINETTGKIIIEPSAINSVGVYILGSETIFKNYGEIIIKADGSRGIVTANTTDIANTENRTFESNPNQKLEIGKINVQNANAESVKKMISIDGKEKTFGDKIINVTKDGVMQTLVKDKLTGKIFAVTNIDAINQNNIEIVNDPVILKKYYLDIAKNHKDLATISSIGMYVDTSGVRYTNPIQGIENIRGLNRAEFIIGAEASEYTNATTISVGKNILERYNNAISKSGIKKWDVISGSLTWAAAPRKLGTSPQYIGEIIMTKVDYREYSKHATVPYNFLDGLEQRYSMNAIGSKEKKLFNKINSIGKNEAILLSQAFDEMMGHQYSNVEQRIQTTGAILDDELKVLRKEWKTVTKNSNKVKTFGTTGDFKTDTAGVIDYRYNAYGVAYVHEAETQTIGDSKGWYAGIVQNTFKLKDIGRSKEKQLQAKLGLFKSKPFDDENSLNWTVSGDIFVGYNTMNRRYLVVDEIFSAKSKYYNYGASLTNEIAKEFRLSKDFSFKTYAGLKLEYGKISSIKEKSGEIKLEAKKDKYISIKPEIGAELTYKHYFKEKEFKATVSAAYEREMRAFDKNSRDIRLRDTTADWFEIRNEKEKNRGNIKVDLKLGLENQKMGVTANVGYDTKGDNVRAGLGLKVIF